MMKQTQTRWMMGKAMAIATLAVVAGVGTGCHSTRPDALTQTKASQQAMTPAQALDQLQAGNQRFVEGKPLQRDLVAQRQATGSGQYPFAVVLSCLDSRTSTELIFDQGIGDIFNARVAGNVVNEDILGSMEFACKVAGSKLIAVIGHTKCGAVKGACADVELGNLTGLLEKIQPAVAKVPGDAKNANEAHVDAVARENVRLVMAQIREKSPILDEMIQSGQVGLVGGMHDLSTGRVTFFR